jgi:hypothetical protein
MAPDRLDPNIGALIEKITRTVGGKIQHDLP